MGRPPPCLGTSIWTLPPSRVGRVRGLEENRANSKGLKMTVSVKSMGPLQLSEVGGQILSEDVSGMVLFSPQKKDVREMSIFIILSHSLMMFSASPVYRCQGTQGWTKNSFSFLLWFNPHLLMGKSLPIILDILIWVYATVNQISRNRAIVLH